MGFCLFALVVMATVLSGCAGSSPSKFYMLSSIISQDRQINRASDKPGIIVAIGPLSIPDYLKRSQIVTRAGRNELKVDDFSLWAGSLEGDITRVLVENISAMLPAELYSVVRWNPASQAQMPIDFRAAVEIIRLDGTPGDSVTLKAQWTVFRKGDGRPLMSEINIAENLDNAAYGEMVAGMSRALEALGREIAEAILSRRD